MRVLTTLALAVSPLLVSGAFAQEQDWRFAHPGATLVGGIRVESLLQSPIFNKLIEQSTAKDPAKSAMVGMMRQALSGVTEVRISIRDIGNNKEPDVLTLVTGHIDDASTAGLLTADNKMKMHRIDANTMLLGEAASIDEAVRRLARPVGLESAAVKRGRAMKNYEFWLAGALPNMPMTAVFGDMLHGLALGVGVQTDLRLELAIDTASPKMAAELVKSARESQQKQPALAGTTLQAEVDGSTARLRMVVDGDRVVQAVQEAIANGGVGTPVAGLIGASRTPAAPPKPERKTIIIYGLDDGPRVIDPSKP